GSRETKDFTIRSAAGGAINRAVQRDFKVQVSENFLEIHLFWGGKWTCCIPVQGDFNSTNKLGEGGFGPIYKGILSDGREVAVKTLLVTSHQGKSQFLAEISTISAVQHRNLVKLYGCYIEGSNRLLVYEYHKKKSLDQVLFGKNALHLDWPTQYSICLGAARGLAYLHEESKPGIIH
ncbi:hypothetical protein IFM89_022261, partial [Coptis chinensis]